MYKQDLALYTPQELICLKTQPNQTVHACAYINKIWH